MPFACSSLEEVHMYIDRIDRDQVALIARRGDCGADPRVVEATWHAMIAAFIASELQAHAALPTHPPTH